MKHEWNPWVIKNWSVPEAEWNDPALPMVSLGVLNYNRVDELRQTLDVLTNAVQYPNYEIILVDNGSTDGGIEMVRAEYPQVRLYEVGANLGVSSRNFQTQLARGKYLFSFDDDTYPGTPAMVLRIVQHMEAYPDIDAVSGTYYQPITGLTETKGWEFYRLRQDHQRGFEGPYVVEGGVCFRVNTLRKVKGYEPAFVCYGDGLDLCIQLYQAHAGIYLCPWFGTLHFASPTNRSTGFRTYAYSRNVIWAIAMHWPLIAAIPLCAILVLRRFIAMIMHPRTLRENARGILDGFLGIRPFLRKRPKLSWKQIWGLRRWYYGLFRWA